MPVVEKLKEMVGMTPTYTTEEREQIRTDARTAAKAGWFNMVLDHHVAIESAFAAVKAAKDAAGRAAAQKKLEVLLTGHSNAEEAILYPAMSLKTSSTDAKHAYAEQAMAKMEMVALDEIPDKTSRAYDDKLEEIRLAVQHHMVEEERDFFPSLAKDVDSAMSAKMTELYKAEFSRYES